MVSDPKSEFDDLENALEETRAGMLELVTDLQGAERLLAHHVKSHDQNDEVKRALEAVRRVLRAMVSA